LDCAYKLVEYAGKARRKRSEGKVLWPGRKQVFRKYDDAGRMAGDVLSVQGDKVEGEPLIQLVMNDGQRIGAAMPLVKSRQRTLSELSRLPEPLRKLERGPEYPVVVSEALRRLAEAVDAAQLRAQSSEPKTGVEPTIGA